MQTQKAKTKVKKREREKGFIARMGWFTDPHGRTERSRGLINSRSWTAVGWGAGGGGLCAEFSLPCSFTTTEMINILHFCASERGKNTISF